MKIRIFENMDDSVFRVVVNTEDFSQDDLRLMCQYGEPEVNAGGTIYYTFDNETKTKELGDQFVRILHGFPFAIGFDSRDYGDGEAYSGDPPENSLMEAMAVGESWKSQMKLRISAAMETLRSKSKVLPTEEVVNV